MCWWLYLLVLLFPMATSSETPEGYDGHMPILRRTVRAFPYSVSLNQMLRHNRRLYAISDDDLSSIIDQLNSEGLQRKR